MQTPYPIEALPPIISDAVKYHHTYCQQPISLIATAALTQISIACQGLVDIRRNSDLTSPVSLYAMVIAESGERKSTADNAFGKAIRDYEAGQFTLFDMLMVEYQSKLDVWETEHAGMKNEIKRLAGNVKKRNTKEASQLREEFERHNQLKPIPPASPKMLYEDVNQQSLAINLYNGRPSAALMSDEGGILIGSNGMNKDQCLSFFAFLNRLWDGKNSYNRDRLTTQSCELKGRRLTVSLMLQVGVLRKLISLDDESSRNTGFLARILVACPGSTMGSRFYKEPPESSPEMEAFHNRMKDILDIPLPEQQEENRRLIPRELLLSDDAKALWIDYFNEVEAKIGNYQEFSSIPDFASKSAENAVRIAGCLHVFTDGLDSKVSADTMARAILIARWHLQETLCLFDTIDTSQEDKDVLMLWDWLFKKKPEEITLTYLRNYAPNQLRKNGRHKVAMERLDTVS